LVRNRFDGIEHRVSRGAPAEKHSDCETNPASQAASDHKTYPGGNGQRSEWPFADSPAE
jgi:hypothetical protein